MTSSVPLTSAGKSELLPLQHFISPKGWHKYWRCITYRIARHYSSRKARGNIHDRYVSVQKEQDRRYRELVSPEEVDLSPKRDRPFEYKKSCGQ